MYGMTAAHKTLPLPSYARVTNLRNGRSVVVRINDRGPFVANRIIDLSYTAAAKLDMLREGTTLVEVRTLDPRRRPMTLTRSAAAPPPALYVQAGGVRRGGTTRSGCSRGCRRAGLAQRCFVLSPDRGRTRTCYPRCAWGRSTSVADFDQLAARLQRSAFPTRASPTTEGAVRTAKPRAHGRAALG